MRSILHPMALPLLCVRIDAIKASTLAAGKCELRRRLDYEGRMYGLDVTEDMEYFQQPSSISQYA